MSGRVGVFVGGSETDAQMPCSDALLWYSVLQCVAVCCRVLQCVAAFCSLCVDAPTTREFLCVNICV